MPPVNYRDYSPPGREGERFTEALQVDGWCEPRKREKHILAFFRWAKPDLDPFKYREMELNARVFACSRWHRHEPRKGLSPADLQYRAEYETWALMFQDEENRPEWPFPSPPQGQWLFHPREHGYSCQYTQWRASLYLLHDEQEFAEEFCEHMAAESRMASARRRANKEDGVDEDGADKALQNMEALGLEEADTSVQATAAATTGAAANEGEATSEATPENQGEQANAALESRADDVEDVAAQNERFNLFFEQIRRQRHLDD